MFRGGQPGKLNLKVPPCETSLRFPAAQSGNIDGAEMVKTGDRQIPRVLPLFNWQAGLQLLAGKSEPEMKVW